MLTSLQSWFANRRSKFAVRHGSRFPKPSTYLKQALLFMLTVVLPSSALVLLSLRMIAQETELAQKRSSERREQVGRQFGETLLRHLREVADRTAALEPAQIRGVEWRLLDLDLALVALVANNQLVLPWEHNPDAEAFAKLLRQAPFGDSLAEGQRFEFGQGELRLALASYREAVELGGLPAQREYARLALARVLSKMGETQEAEKELASVLKMPAATRDEFDVPLSFYAAGQLLSQGRQLELVFSTLVDALASGADFSPAAAYMARDYLEQLHFPDRNVQIEKLLRQLRAQVVQREQWEQLKKEFSFVRAALAREQDGSGFAKRWTVWGIDPWLVSMVPLRVSEEPALLAVNAGNFGRRALRAGGSEAFGDVLQRGKAASETTPSPPSDGGEGRGEEARSSLKVAPLLNPLPAPPSRGEEEEARIVRGPHAQGVWLGEEFPNLQLILPPSALASRVGEPQLRLYSTLIVLVVGITLFGAYLWWRDTRRELKLAEIRSDFVSSVSHELKTPLTSVQMLAETLRIRELTTKERNEYLDLILSESERLGRLLKNVLDFSQIEKGTKVYQLEPVDLTPVIEAAVRLVQRPLREKNLELDVSSSGAGIVLNADGDALEQAVLNLLYNAIKYSSKDGRIELRAERIGGDAVIQVRDYGVGIHPRDHQRIFERFYRAPEDHNRRIPGTGLGLSLVKHIVESHGGRVTVESAPGQGSTFAVHLPVREDD